MKHKSLINILKTIIVLVWAGTGIVIGLSMEHETSLHKITLTTAFGVVLALLSLAAINGVETLATYIRSSRMRRNTKHMELDTPTEEDDAVTKSYIATDSDWTYAILAEPLGDTTLAEPLSNTKLVEPLSNTMLAEPLSNTKLVEPLSNTMLDGLDECIVDCDAWFEDDRESTDCETLCKQTELGFTNKGTKLWLLRASYEQLFNYILNNRLKDNIIDTKGMSKKDVVKLINKVAKLKTKSFVSADYLVDLINSTIDGLIRSMQTNREVNQ